MVIKTKSAHITPSGGNVFLDLGFDVKEAAKLQAETQRVIAEKQAIKEKLMDEITDWINDHQLKQVEAAQLLGVTRPRVSDVINRKTVKFTVDSLIDMLSRTGKSVRLSVRP